MQQVWLGAEPSETKESLQAVLCIERARLGRPSAIRRLRIAALTLPGRPELSDSESLHSCLL